MKKTIIITVLLIACISTLLSQHKARNIEVMSETNSLIFSPPLIAPSSNSKPYYIGIIMGLTNGQKNKIDFGRYRDDFPGMIDSKSIGKRTSIGLAWSHYFGKNLKDCKSSISASMSYSIHLFHDMKFNGDTSFVFIGNTFPAEHTAEYNIELSHLDLSVHYNHALFETPLHISVGVTSSIKLSSDIIKKEKIKFTGSEIPLCYPEKNRTIELEGMNNVLFLMNTRLLYELSIKRVLFAPAVLSYIIGYDWGINNLSKNTEWRMSGINFGIMLTWAIK